MNEHERLLFERAQLAAKTIEAMNSYNPEAHTERRKFKTTASDAAKNDLLAYYEWREANPNA